jgi:hypothetical protein
MDPDPGGPKTRGSGGSGFGSGTLQEIKKIWGVTILKFFDADSESGMEKILIRYGYKVGSEINIPDFFHSGSRNRSFSSRFPYPHQRF